MKSRSGRLPRVPSYFLGVSFSFDLPPSPSFSTGSSIRFLHLRHYSCCGRRYRLCLNGHSGIAHGLPPEPRVAVEKAPAGLLLRPISGLSFLDSIRMSCNGGRFWPWHCFSGSCITVEIEITGKCPWAMPGCLA